MDQELKLYGARQLMQKGWHVTVTEGKVPVLKDWPNRLLTEVELASLLRNSRYNIAVLLRGGVAVLDEDGPLARKFLEERGITSPMVCEATRGDHSYVRTDLEKAIKIPDGDCKPTGIAVVPPSVSLTGKQYRWKNGIYRPEELPFVSKDQLHIEKEVKLPDIRKPITRSVRNPVRYVLQIESHQGSNGSAGLVRAVSVLRDAGWSAIETYQFLLEKWNKEPRVIPPWSPRELEHAILRSFK